MAGKLEDLAFRIVADGRQAIREMRKVGKEAKDETRKVDKETKNHERSMKRSGAAIAGYFLAAFSVVRKLGQAVGESIELYKEQARQEAQLNSVIESTGRAANLTSGDVKRMASSLQDVTNFGDEATISAANLLLTFTKIGRDVFPDALAVTLDMSEALGQDLKSSSIQLGKALNDPIRGVTALQRVGVSFTAGQRAMIASMVQTGDVAGAQRLILEELTREFGGSAEAAVKADDGITQMRNAIGDIQEEIGRRALPAQVKWNQAQLLAAQALEDYIQLQDIYFRQLGPLARGIENVADAWNEASPVGVNFTDALFTLAEAAPGPAGALAQLADNARRAGEEQDEAAARTEQHARVNDAATGRLQGQANAYRDLTGAVLNEQDAEERSARVTEELNEQKERNAELSERQRDELDKLAESILTAAGRSEDYRDALRDAETAITEFNEAEEKTPALADKTADQIQRAAEALAGLTDGSIDSAEEVNSLIDEMFRLGRNAAPQVREELALTIAEILKIPKETVLSFFAEADTATAERQMRNLTQARTADIYATVRNRHALETYLNNLRGRAQIAPRVSGPGGNAFFAEGGDVGRGGGIAGENNRPEIVERGGRSAIVDSPTAVAPGTRVTGERATRGRLGRPSVTNNYVTVHMPPGASAAQVEAALRRYRALEGGEL